VAGSGSGWNLGRAFQARESTEDNEWALEGLAPEGRRAGRPAGTSDYVRFAVLAAASFAAASLVLRWLKGWQPMLTTPFFYFLAGVALSKLTVDILYFVVSPRYREWGQIDDYLLNDFFTFFRFGLPLAVAQAYFLNKGMVPTHYLELWLGPALPLALVLVNRWKIERAQEARWARRGGALDIASRGHRASLDRGR